MPPKFNRYAPLVFFLGLLFLLFAVYLFIRSAANRQALQSLQKQHHSLLDQKRILEGQVYQLQAEHRQKEAVVRLAERELSLDEQQQLANQLQNAQSREKEAQQKALATALELTLRKTATSKEVEVLFESKKLIIRFYDATLFDPGEIGVSASGKKLLTAVGKSLNQDFPTSLVQIEGHSDNSAVPGGLKSRFPSNWELTSYRAATVARSLQEGSDVTAARLTPQGKAGTTPIDSNDTREGRAKNRRIDLVISLQESPGSPHSANPSTP